MKELVTPKQVALAIGVSEASLKRWCDKGLLTVVRTGGGHRRLPINGVLQFLRQGGHQLIRPEILGLPLNTGKGEALIERASDQFRSALEAGDEDQARRIAFNLYLAGHSVVDMGDKVIAAAFHDIGQRWQHGEVEVYEERRGCEICMRILHHLRMVLPFPDPDAPQAIGGTVQEDPYSIPNALVEVALRESGWRAESYGVGLPTETLRTAIERVRPRLVWLSVSTISSVCEFVTNCATLYEAVTRTGGALVVGGRALTEEVRRQARYSAFCDSLQHLAAFAKTLYSPSSEDRASKQLPP